MEFEIRDRVMLKVSPWKGVVRFGKRGKLNLRYVGPFKVLAKVGKVTYKLELLQELSRVHHTFHVSNLKKCYSDEPLVMPLEGVHIEDTLQFVEEPVEIMEWEIKRLKRSQIHWLRFVGTLGGALSSPVPAEDEAPASLLPSGFLSPHIRPLSPKVLGAEMNDIASSLYHSLHPSGTSPLLPIPLSTPSTSRRAGIPEADTPPQNRPLLATPRPRCEVRESSAAAARRPGPTMAYGVDCSYVETRL
nr:putative reverse transcriptase domain-containing protein [Tanacetum cinerariifolium]